MDDNCGEWMECMGVVVRRYIDFLILLIPLLLYLFFFAAAALSFVHKKKSFFVLVPVLFCKKIYV